MNHDQRLLRLETEDNQQPRDIRIDVQYYDTIETVDGRREVPIPAEYDPVDWETIAPDSNGDRIAVRYPRSENPGDAKKESD